MKQIDECSSLEALILNPLHLLLLSPVYERSAKIFPTSALPKYLRRLLSRRFARHKLNASEEDAHLEKKFKVRPSIFQS